MHKKITFRGLLAWVVITPPAMVIGSYIVLSQKLDRILGRSSVRGITGSGLLLGNSRQKPSDA
jgi:hypothetical protein